MPNFRLEYAICYFHRLNIEKHRHISRHKSQPIFMSRDRYLTSCCPLAEPLLFTPYTVKPKWKHTADERLDLNNVSKIVDTQSRTNHNLTDTVKGHLIESEYKRSGMQSEKRNVMK